MEQRPDQNLNLEFADLNSGIVVRKWFYNKCVHTSWIHFAPSAAGGTKSCDRRS